MNSPTLPGPTTGAVRPKKRGGILAKLALAFASLILFLAAAEVILGWMGFGKVEIYEPDARLFWRLKPNQDRFTKVDNKPVHINSRGTRGGEFTVPKPPGTLRILAVGDSKTFGWGLTEDEAYPKRLETLLQPHLPAGTKVEVINAGVNAWGYPQIKLFLKDPGFGWQPDFVLLGDANLWTQFSEDSDPQFVKQMLGRVRLKNLLRRSAIYHFLIEVQLETFYQRYKTKFIPVDPKQDQLFKEAQKNDPDAVFKKAIEDICQLSVAANIKPVIMYIPILTDMDAGAEGNVQKAKRDIAKKLGLPFIDFTPDIKPGGASLYLTADPVHLNAKGCDIVGGKLATLFQGLIPPAPAVAVPGAPRP